MVVAYALAFAVYISSIRGRNGEGEKTRKAGSAAGDERD
jgi:hypothetical protein